MTLEVTLADLVREGIGTLRGDSGVVLRGVSHDSRAVQPGDLFVAIPGANVDGRAYAAAAVARGAVAVVTEQALEVAVPQLLVHDARRELARAADVVYGHPTFALEVVGITGTNGKTTTAWMVESMLRGLGATPALMGTVLFRGPGIERPTSHTTPEGDDVARFAREVLDAGATHLVMEVSSHALSLHRVDAVRFRVAAFTNLTQDHLDFHGDLERYAAAKGRLFRELQPGAMVLNVDDPFGATLARGVSSPCLRVSRLGQQGAEVRVLAADSSREGTRARVSTPEGEIELRSPLLGDHNLENLLVALGCGLALGFPAADVARALGAAAGAPGRLERVDDPRDVAVLVDYAHTPDALARVLRALRPLTPGRLLVVFGCGGDRDRLKRPLMGEAAARAADLCVVTSDNPRTEAPEAIVADILPGVLSAGRREVPVAALGEASGGYACVVDRGEAISAILGAARPGDTVLIAGKGHEDHQIVGHDKRPFDDREVARAAIARHVGRR